jgi:hypothetical protein
LLALALAIAALAALPSPALADPPAQGEYTLNMPSANGSNGSPEGQADGSTGSSNVAVVVVLIVCCAAIGVGAVVVQRRRSTPTE